MIKLLTLTLLCALGISSGAFAQSKTATLSDQSVQQGTTYRVPSLAEVQKIAGGIAQQIVDQYPAEDRSTALGILHGHYSSDFIKSVYEAGVTNYFTAEELRRIENEAGFAETPVIKEKIKKSAQLMAGMQMQAMFQSLTDLAMAGLPPPNLKFLGDLQKFTKQAN